VCEIELLSAPKLCQDLKVVSQNDRAKLEEAKTKLYREGFTYGIMRVGEHSGKPGKQCFFFRFQSTISDNQSISVPQLSSSVKPT
jgi:hypothetical protein